MNSEQLKAPVDGTVSLSQYDPDDKCGYDDKDAAVAKLKNDIHKLEKLQDVLSAQNRYGVLIIFQGMDTAGKDGAVKHVMSGVNPVAVNVHGFKAPSDEERHHDFLWRYSKKLPERGRIAIFNRSHYEDVLVVRVHPELLGSDLSAPSADFWNERYEAINNFERHLADEGTIILKFFLYISKDEQARRLKARIDDPAKQWKCSISDFKEREFWDTYMGAFETAIKHTSTAAAPWYVIPSNHKYVAHIAIADAIVSRLEGLNMQYPTLSPAVVQELKEIGAKVLGPA